MSHEECIKKFFKLDIYMIPDYVFKLDLDYLSRIISECMSRSYQILPISLLEPNESRKVLKLIKAELTNFTRQETESEYEPSDDEQYESDGSGEEIAI